MIRLWVSYGGNDLPSMTQATVMLLCFENLYLQRNKTRRSWVFRGPNISENGSINNLVNAKIVVIIVKLNEKAFYIFRVLSKGR